MLIMLLSDGRKIQINQTDESFRLTASSRLLWRSLESCKFEAQQESN